MEGIKTYTQKFRLGIDDLKSEVPFWIDDWGVEHWYLHFGWTKEEYNADKGAYAAKIRIENEEYIEKLNSQGKLGTIAENHIHFKMNPLFDSPTPISKSFESHKMIFIDTSDYNQ